MSPLNFGLVSGTQFNLGLETLAFCFLSDKPVR